jgi:hypothetical protein
MDLRGYFLGYLKRGCFCGSGREDLRNSLVTTAGSAADSAFRNEGPFRI